MLRHRGQAITGFPCVLLLLLLALQAPAAPPARKSPASERGVLDPLLYRDLSVGGLDQVRRLEIVQMLSAVASGSQMGPGDGWFRPSQSRYDWKWLARRFDADGDGRITPAEFKGSRELFAALDRDRDGVLTAEDVDWSERSAFARQLGMVSQWMYRIDTSSNGRISKQEWEEFFEKSAQGKGHLTQEDLRAALTQVPKRTGPPPKGPSPATLMAGLLNGELGSFLHGPAVGERAPGFTLKTHDGKRSISLSEFRGKVPVVLIFGSFT